MKKGVLLVMYILSSVAFAQQRTYEFIIKGKEYKGLNIRAGDTLIKGTKVNQLGDSYTWHFLIPDSVFDNSYLYRMTYEPIEPNEGYVVYDISCRMKLNGDSIGFVKGVFESDFKTTLTYIKTIREDSVPSVFDGAFVDATFLTDAFYVEMDEGSEWDIFLKHPFFCEFIDFKHNRDPKPTHSQYIAEYMEAVKQYPNSTFLLSQLARNTTHFDSSEELATVFNEFSTELKSSPIGKKIQDAIVISKTFTNLELPVMGTSRKEKMVEDTTCYNLIVFSASWCAPCHKIIPSLKELYAELHPKLQITYVTIDEEEFVTNWVDLMKKEQIQWRSLMAKGMVKEVQGYYNIGGVPVVLLVHPGGKEYELVILNHKLEEGKRKEMERVRQYIRKMK